MSTVFDRWSELDTALLLRRIEAAHGSVVFDRYAYADPQHALRQIESVFGVALNTAGALSFSAIAAAIDAAVAGGGGDTNWVPANAKIHIDLVNNRAWTEADGEVAIDTLLGADPNTVNAWSASNYDPAQLTAYGYVAPENIVLALIGGARERVLSGSTLVLRNIIPTSDLIVGLSFVIASATGNNSIEIDLSNNNNIRDVFAYSGGGLANLTFAPIVNVGVNGAINTLAATVTSARLELSVNGSTALSTALTTDDFPVSGDVLVAALISQPNAANALQSITIYDALPDTTGLSALSATGVTNTAPRNFTFNEALASPDRQTGPFDFTLPATDFVSSSYFKINQINATDDEGNPLTLTMPDTGGGVFALTDANTDIGVPIESALAGSTNINAAMVAYNAGIAPAPDVYNFTLRATDPGGLYVEQVFTITVTA